MFGQFLKDAEMRIILGSQSKARAIILKKMGYKFIVMPANIDEKLIRDPNPTVMTMKIAMAKARAVMARLKKPAILIASDQVVACAGEILEKPETDREAFRQIKLYNSYPAETVTSVVVIDTATGRDVAGTDTAKIWFHYIPEEVISAYIETRDPFSHSGAFDHEHPMMKEYVRKIDGEPESISGFPMALTRCLIEAAQKAP